MVLFLLAFRCLEQLLPMPTSRCAMPPRLALTRAAPRDMPRAIFEPADEYQAPLHAAADISPFLAKKPIISHTNTYHATR